MTATVANLAIIGISQIRFAKGNVVVVGYINEVSSQKKSRCPLPSLIRTHTPCIWTYKLPYFFSYKCMYIRLNLCVFERIICAHTYPLCSLIYECLFVHQGDPLLYGVNVSS